MPWDGSEMPRLAAILAACAMVVVLGLAVSWGVQKLMLLMFSHPLPKWVPHLAGVFSSLTTFIVVWQNRGKRSKKDDESLTPLVRRDPVTGLRQL
jgi:hypothetical protein